MTLEISSVGVLQGFVLCLFLIACSLLLIWAERKILSSAENRHGPNRIGKKGGVQFFADTIKIFHRTRDPGLANSRSNSIYLMCALAIPFVFFFFLVQIFTEENPSSLHLLILYFLLIVSQGFDGLLQYSSANPAERYELKKVQVQSLLAGAVWLVCLLIAITHSGGEAIESFVAFRSPALALSSILSFIIIFYLFGVSPIGFYENRYLSGIDRAIYFVTKRLWIVSMLSLWCLLFFVGPLNSPFAFALLAAILSAAIFILLCIQSAFSRVRIDNSTEFLSVYLLPISVIALVIELVWLIFFNG